MSKAPLKERAKRRLGRGDQLVKTRPEQKLMQGSTIMADDKVHPTATEMDYPAHFRNYSGFLALLKWGVIISAITTFVVLYAISN
jgi:hypothetical protein